MFTEIILIIKSLGKETYDQCSKKKQNRGNRRNTWTDAWTIRRTEQVKITVVQTPRVCLCCDIRASWLEAGLRATCSLHELEIFYKVQTSVTCSEGDDDQINGRFLLSLFLSLHWFPALITKNKAIVYKTILSLRLTMAHINEQRWLLCEVSG